MLAEALAVGREGNPVERVIADARTAIRGVTLTPRVTYDADALAERIVAYADSLALEPVDALGPGGQDTASSCTRVWPAAWPMPRCRSRPRSPTSGSSTPQPR